MFKTVRLFKRLVKFSMLGAMDDPSLYPGEVDPDGKIKADQEIMEDEMEDEMETPPAGYQGQFTLRDPTTGSKTKVLYGGPNFVPNFQPKPVPWNAPVD